jgi:peptidoglycan-N-acetylglucosamine deacetylase
MSKRLYFVICLVILGSFCSVQRGTCETISSVQTSSNCIALTFDDGPSPKNTPRILDTLARFGSKAIFFVLGECAELFPEILRQAVKQGNEIGNHTYNHPFLERSTAAKAAWQIGTTQDIVSEIIDSEPAVFRPPYGSMNRSTPDIARQHGLKTIMWSIDPRDWKNPSPQEICRRVLKDVKPGGILLLHDSHANTAAALPLILEGLAKKGIRCVTVSELLKM